jgi:hypothetical protein
MAGKAEAGRQREHEKGLAAEQRAHEIELTGMEIDAELDMLRKKLQNETNLTVAQIDAAMNQLEAKIASEEKMTKASLANAIAITEKEITSRETMFEAELANAKDQFDRKLKQDARLAGAEQTHEYRMFSEDLAQKKALTEADLAALMERFYAELEFPQERAVAEIYARGQAADASDEERFLYRFFEHVNASADGMGLLNPVMKNVDHQKVSADPKLAARWRDAFASLALDDPDYERMIATWNQFYGVYLKGPGAGEGGGTGGGVHDKYNWTNIDPGVETELFMAMTELLEDKSVRVGASDKLTLRGAIRGMEQGKEMTDWLENQLREIINKFYPTPQEEPPSYGGTRGF